MDHNSQGIEHQRLLRQRTARRWIREGGVVIAADAAYAGHSRLEFSETVACGVPLQVTFNLREVSKACKFLTDYAIYLWNCDRAGDYALYGALENSSYLHAELNATSDRPAFKRIAATCYAGSYPDMHIDVYDAQQRPAASADRPLLTRMLLPQGICAAIYQNTAVQEIGVLEERDSSTTASAAVRWRDTPRLTRRPVAALVSSL